MTRDKPLLELDDVTVRYGTVEAVRDVTVRVATGEVLSVVGPSGSGKSTLIRAVGGLEPVDGGRIVLGNETVSSDSVLQRPQDRDVGMVFQNFALWPHKTVRENVAFPLRHGKTGRDVGARVAEMLDLVELDGYGDRYPGDLSGGQQQRVALARALAPDPSLLLLDECLSSLDARLKDRMLTELDRIQSEVGVTTIYVTHDQQDAMRIADRIAVLRDGALQQVGVPSEVYRSPANEFVARFVGDINVLTRDELSRCFDGPDRGRAAGSRVGIRPEDVRIRRAAATDGPRPTPSGDARWRATASVEESVFLGDRTRHVVRVDDTALTVLDASRTTHAEGSEVRVVVDGTALIDV